jgi:hypothetical protein
MSETPRSAGLVTSPASHAPAPRSVTLRSILLGVAVSTASSLWVNHIEYVVHASRQLTGSQFPFGVLMVYLAVALLLNPLCRLLSARAALSSPELLVVLACGLVGGTIPSVGLTGYLLGAIAAPYYFATPENQWADYFHPHIPEWLAPRNADGALTYLFEGLPPGASIPWSDEEGRGTPITGRVVWDATTPARCAAWPAPRMIAPKPRFSASRARRAVASGERCAEVMSIS